MEHQEKVLVTQAGYEELKSELSQLVHEERDKVILDLQEARAQGDLSENADYDAARDNQARLEARIADLESMLSNVEIIDDTKIKKKVVSLGSTVDILDLDSDEVETYTIVGSVEADPFKGKLSNVTPLAMAILDCKVGATATVYNVEKPYKVKIISLK